MFTSSLSLSLRQKLIQHLVVVLYTRAYAVWEGAKKLVIPMIFVFCVSNTTWHLPMQESGKLTVFRAASQDQRTQYSSSLEPYVRSVRSHPMYFLLLTNLNSPLAFHISHGCILEIGNNDAWIDLTVLLLSESREYQYYPHACVRFLHPANERRFISVALGILLSKSIIQARALRDCA